MKYGLVVILSVIVLNCAAQEAAPEGEKWIPPYHLDQPQNWGAEHFLIPVSFAPSIKYKGVEDIRFTPGWGKKETEEYWSYAFLWYLSGNISLDVKTIEKNLSAYYTGLLYANIDTAKNKTVKINTATVTVTAIKAEKNASESFEATVNTMDYMTLQPLQLNLRIHQRFCKEEDKTFVFHEVSPKTYDHEVWGRLHALWQSLRCKK